EGRSAGVRLPFEAAAAAVAAAVEAAAGPEPATWLGYSLGGRLALRVALDRPDLVEALVLLSAAASSGSSTDGWPRTCSPACPGRRRGSTSGGGAPSRASPRPCASSARERRSRCGTGWGRSTCPSS